MSKILNNLIEIIQSEFHFEDYILNTNYYEILPENWILNNETCEYDYIDNSIPTEKIEKYKLLFSNIIFQTKVSQMIASYNEEVKKYITFANFSFLTKKKYLDNEISKIHEIKNRLALLFIHYNCIDQISNIDEVMKIITTEKKESKAPPLRNRMAERLNTLVDTGIFIKNFLEQRNIENIIKLDNSDSFYYTTLLILVKEISLTSDFLNAYSVDITESNLLEELNFNNKIKKNIDDLVINSPIIKKLLTEEEQETNYDTILDERLDTFKLYKLAIEDKLILMDIKKFSVFINCFSPNPKNGKIILNDKDYSQHEILPFAYKFKEYIVDKFNKSHKSKYDKFIKQRFKFEKGNINHISAIRGRETKDDKLKCLIDEIFEKSTHKE